MFYWPVLCLLGRESTNDTRTQTPPQRWNRNVCNSHVSQLRGGMFVCICENLTYEHTHRHAAMWNATSVGWLAGWPGLAVVSSCSRCSRLWPWHICVCFKSQPLPLGRWQSSSAWGDETWDRQSLVVNNNSFMRQRRLPAAFKDLSERQRLLLVRPVVTKSGVPGSPRGPLKLEQSGISLRQAANNIYKMISISAYMNFTIMKREPNATWTCATDFASFNVSILFYNVSLKKLLGFYKT